MREYLWAEQHGRCAYCQCWTYPGPHEGGKLRPFDATLDHVQARSTGGFNDSTNLVVACNQCNSELGSLGL